MKILVIGDLHGRIPKIKTTNIDYIICVGDFCEDRKIAKYTKMWSAYIKKEEAKSTDTNILNWDEFIIDKIGEEKFEKLHEESLIGGRKVLEYINSLNIPTFIVPGNWDQSYGYSRIQDTNKSNFNYKKAFLDWYLNSKGTNKQLIKGLKNILDTQYKLYETEEFNILGYGLSSAPEEIKNTGRLGKKKIQILKNTYNKILTKLTKEYKKRNKKKLTIFLSHNTPYGTKLDTITDKNSYVYKQHLGSTIARDFINQTSPRICLSGHIHDHFGQDKIKKTKIINAGFGSNKNITLEIKNNKIISIKFQKNNNK